MVEIDRAILCHTVAPRKYHFTWTGGGGNDSSLNYDRLVISFVTSLRGPLDR